MAISSALLLLVASIIKVASAHPQNHGLISRATSGCGKTPIFPNLDPFRSVESSGKKRIYKFHLPESYDVNKPYPIVVGFHGSSSVGTFFELDTKLNEKRYSGDKIMIYPDGLRGSWAGPSYHKDKDSTVAEDIQFVSDLIEHVKGEFCVDEDKVFGVGMSNGAGFIGTLACDRVGSTLFRAFASHSGAFYTDINGPNNGCEPSRPVPMLEIHGATDTTVKYEGGQGEGGALPPISDWLEWWSQRNHCTSKKGQTLYDAKVHHYTWKCGDQEGFLQHYKIEEMKHCWADTEPNVSQITVGQGPTVVRASEIVMDFFDSMA